MKNDVKYELQKHTAEVEVQADLIMSKTRDWQMIKQYMANRMKEFKLTSEQIEKKTRYQFMYNEMMTGKSTDYQVVNMTKNHFEISLSQAYEDLKFTKEVFSDIINVDKIFDLQLSLELNRKYQAKADAIGDLKALASFEKNRESLLKQLPDQENRDAENFEGHTYELTFDPRLLGAPPVDMKKVLDAINAKRHKPINTDMFPELESEDIPDE